MEFEHGFINGDPAMVLRDGQQQYVAHIVMRFNDNMYNYKDGICDGVSIINRLHNIYPHLSEYTSLRELIKSKRYFLDASIMKDLSRVLLTIVTERLRDLTFFDKAPDDQMAREIFVFSGRLVGCLEATYLADVLPNRSITDGLRIYDINHKEYIEKTRDKPLIMNYYNRINLMMNI